MCNVRFPIFLLVLFLTVTSKAQGIVGYIRDRGVNLAEMTHTSNDFINGRYSSQGNGYTDLTIFSRDPIFDRVITTKIRLIHGFGSLYFKDIKIISDNDITNPFDAFGLQAVLLSRLIRAVDRAQYDKMRFELKRISGKDFEEWSGKEWALLALNLDYFNYLSQ